MPPRMLGALVFSQRAMDWLKSNGHAADATIIETACANYRATLHGGNRHTQLSVEQLERLANKHHLSALKIEAEIRTR